jgi:hypothetical protein
MYQVLSFYSGTDNELSQGKQTYYDINNIDLLDNLENIKLRDIIDVWSLSAVSLFF